MKSKKTLRLPRTERPNYLYKSNCMPQTVINNNDNKVKEQYKVQKAYRFFVQANHL
jgi:hypothetical protein